MVFGGLFAAPIPTSPMGSLILCISQKWKHSPMRYKLQDNLGKWYNDSDFQGSRKESKCALKVLLFFTVLKTHTHIFQAQEQFQLSTKTVFAIINHAQCWLKPSWKTNVRLWNRNDKKKKEKVYDSKYFSSPWMYSYLSSFLHSEKKKRLIFKKDLI